MNDDETNTKYSKLHDINGLWDIIGPGFSITVYLVDELGGRRIWGTVLLKPGSKFKDQAFFIFVSRWIIPSQ